MSDTQLRPPTWFWIVSALAVLWNVMGLAAFVMDFTMSPETLASLPEKQQAMYAAMPSWGWVPYGVATVAGTLGAIALLSRKAWAIPLFALSLLGVILQDIGSFVVAEGLALLGPTAIILPAAVLMLGIALFFFARRSAARGWLA